MSYDISLYSAGFLRRAIESNLGDWTGSDPIAPETLAYLVEMIRTYGFVETVPDPALVAVVINNRY